MEILKYTLPALLVLIASVVAIWMLLKEERERRSFELRKKDRSVTTPIRLRGCERLALLLERISPEHLLMNTDISSACCFALKNINKLVCFFCGS